MKQGSLLRLGLIALGGLSALALTGCGDDGSDPAAETGGVNGTGTGGGPSSGGASSGGATSGGSMSTGGATIGGSTASGGATTGGVSSGGAPGLGGDPSGGVSSGGTESGGMATGGVSGGTQSGGADTGGASSGGSESGGAESGGASSGGSESGGAETGGVSSGGTDTGGVSAGGSETGGAPTGGTGTGGTAGTTFSPRCGQTIAGDDAGKGVACVAEDVQLCYKTCGPESKGFKSETCTDGAYVEQSGCSFPTDQDYSCYSIPAALDATCPAETPQATTACTVALCTLCADAQGQYLDSGGSAKTGYCVCKADSTWSCASTTAWPCPGGPGCL